MSTTTTQQGTITASGLAELLLSLHASSATGRLRAWRDDVSRDLWLRAGRIVCAESSASSDSLEWMLFTAGQIAADRQRQVHEMIAAGARRGCALIESGSLTAASLCDWTSRRCRFLAADLLTWRDGEFEFEAATAPPPGAITVCLSPAAILLEVLRDPAGGSGMATDLPGADAVPASTPDRLQGGDLLAQEKYVLALADGARPVSEICFLSELGEMETLRILAVLMRAGCLVDTRHEPAAAPARGPGQPAGDAALMPPDLPAGETSSDLRAIVRIYNDLFGIVVGHVIKEVGPIAEQLLDKHLKEVRELHAGLLARTGCGRDGALPDEVLVRNLNLLRQPNRRELLVRALSDYLHALLAALRRLLGPEHEAVVLRRLRETRCTRT